MSEREVLKGVIKRLIEDVWNEQRLDVVSEVFLPDATINLTSGALKSSDALRDEFIRPTQIAFPDLHHDIADIFVDGNKVAMRYVGSGTHRGDFDGKAATGKTLTYEGIVLFHMEGDCIAEVWNHSNWSEKFAEL